MHIARELVNGLLDQANAPRVIVYGAEQRNPYNRVHLSSFLAGDIEPDAFHDNVSDLADKRIEMRIGYTVEKIDRENHLIVDHNGHQTWYSTLILATGSRPRWFNIPGIEKQGVFTFRDLDDAEKLAARRLRTRSTVIIGGGLLGLETARAMRRFNTEITIVEHNSRLMFNQLDDAAAATLEKGVEASGIRVITGQSVVSVLGDQSVEAVELNDERVLRCDTLIVAAGITPNIELAKACGLSFGRGITVDSHMRSSDPDIFAVGECAEINDIVYGLVAPGLEQAAVAAKVIRGETAQFHGGSVSTTLKVLSIPVFSAGEINNSALPLQRSSFHGNNDSGEETYRLISIDRGRLVGAAAVGDWPEIPHLKELLRKQAFIWPWQRRRFVKTGNLSANGQAASVADWPADSTICSCLTITRGQIGAAVSSGSTTIEQIALATRASTVCGSCKPLLAEILGGQSAPSPIPACRTVAIMSLICLLAGIIALGLPGLPYTKSVQAAPNWNWLWTESLYKQISGFTLLGLAFFATLLSLRKRLPEIAWLNYSTWRFVHIGVGIILLITLLAHTGFRLGAELNFLLMSCFLIAAMTGAIGGLVAASEHRLQPTTAKLLRKATIWSHLLVMWPLPALTSLPAGFGIGMGWPGTLPEIQRKSRGV